MRRLGVAAAVSMLCVSTVPAQALELTPPQTEGPYYPRRKPAETDADLTRIGNGPAALGERLVLGVRIVDPSDRAIEGARVEIWQVDHQGIYLHPDDPNARRRDPAFQSYGEARTDAAGAVRFTTIVPPAYEGRPRHIHVKVTPPGAATLTTQLYFAGDPLLGRDGIARRLGKALELVTLRVTEAGGERSASIRLVVRRGAEKTGR